MGEVESESAMHLDDARRDPVLGVAVACPDHLGPVENKDGAVASNGVCRWGEVRKRRRTRNDANEQLQLWSLKAARCSLFSSVISTIVSVRKRAQRSAKEICWSFRRRSSLLCL